MTPPESPDEPTARPPGSSTRRRRRRGNARDKQHVSGATPIPEPPRRAPQAASATDRSRATDQSKETGSAKESGQNRDSDRGWRELAGNAPSQVGPVGAMRARDLNRPTPEDLAAAERNVVIVRRQWQPPEARPNR